MGEVMEFGQPQPGDTDDATDKELLKIIKSRIG